MQRRTGTSQTVEIRTPSCGQAVTVQIEARRASLEAAEFGDRGAKIGRRGANPSARPNGYTAWSDTRQPELDRIR